MINLEIDYDTADKITVNTLQDYLDSLTLLLSSGDMHKDDIEHTVKMIDAIKFVIGDFRIAE
jgi:hypothetical protein